VSAGPREPPSVAAAKVFITYRREETAAHAGRLHDAMAARFGEGNVFMDVDMAPGVDFVERITEAVASCHVLIVVMGPGWATIRDAQGPRIANPEDLVRLEVETALRRPDVTPIPVLVSGARMPNREDLPPEVRAITRRNALELSDLRWRYDVGRLMSRLDELLAEIPLVVAPPAPERSVAAGKAAPVDAAEAQRKAAPPPTVAAPRSEDKPPKLAETLARTEGELIRPPARRIVPRVAVISAGTKSQPAAVAVGAGAVWVANKGSKTAWRIDPATNKIAAKVSIGANQHSAAITHDAVWMGRVDAVYRIDPATNAVVNRLAVSAYALAAGEGAVWAGLFDEICKIDPTTDRVAFRVPLVNGGQVAAGAGSVWITASPWGAQRVDLRDPSVLLRMNPQTGLIVSRIRLGAESHLWGAAVAVEDGAVWVAGGDFGEKSFGSPTIWEIDPSSERVVRTARLQPQTAPLTALVAEGGYLWALQHGRARVFRIETKTLEVVASSRMKTGGSAHTLAFGEGSAWITDFVRNAVLRINM
jgi:TIR domain